MSNLELGNSLLKTIAQPDAIEAVAELAEVALDEAIELNLLQDIPIVGTLSKFINAKVKIQEQFLIRKLKKFLLCLQDIDSEQKKEFQNKLDDDPEYAKKVGEKLIITLDRLDDLGKAELLAKLFQVYMQERIDQQLFFRLTQAIDKAFYADLMYLLNPETSLKYDKMVYEQLQSTGLVKIADYAVISTPNEEKSGLFAHIPMLPPPPRGIHPNNDPNRERAKIKLVLSELGEFFCEILKNDH